ncbi:FKBP-type peptidyl-prolyl cis-trans isomerase [Larkinella arboricola]|uniref:Peptidyl-prolyl cis-trans isomerase n=1 Tax=Larkinella arboricola TaxID=643671 RepID=A0A327X8V3_LARAB|nr:FKBP-type peptidyl-prolyl cis-trans isomerase [Larkinella arboricola]RAK02484.1 FKBP-type peptidyl-prolyl isomerase-like protein [Larkinella arboricola]
MKSKQFSILIALLLGVGMTSCMKDLDNSSAVEAQRNDQEIRSYLTANKLQDSVSSSLSGLYHIITPANSGAKQTKAGEELEFTYVLSYIDPSNPSRAVVVDTANRTKSIYIPFLSGVVIPGLEEGLVLMKEGQRGRFYMPSNIAFGNDTRNNKMPAYSAVIFDVQLKRSRTEMQQIDDFVRINKLSNPILVSSGIPADTNKVRVYKTTQGTGEKITAGKTVTVAYTATLFRATTSFSKSDSLTFKLGSGQYITGFDKGVEALTVGDKAWLVFPSALGYGTQGSVNQSGTYVVPPSTPLAYEITVKSVK